jgi:hypothetical protein
MTLRKGDVFDESEVFDDPVTSKLTRRLTSGRDFNQTPTYHLNAAFSADSRLLVMATWMRDGDSCLLKSEVETGKTTVLAVLPKGIGERYTGNNISIVQASGWVLANTGRTLRMCHVETLEERELLALPESEQRFGHPVGSIDGTKVFVPRLSSRVIPHETKDVTTTHLEIDIRTGEAKVLLEDPGCGCNHVVPNPVDPDLLLIDRERAPAWSHGSDDGRTSRVWLLHRRTGRLTEIRPRDGNRFQIHSNWNCRGDRVFYHGTSRGGGHYIGAANLEGRVVFERHYPEFHYGHTSSHPREDVIITDGLLTPNMVIAIHYNELDSHGAPRHEVLARHDTVWTRGQQQSHPHCHVSPDGRWLSYNRGVDGVRSDVYVVRVR